MSGIRIGSISDIKDIVTLGRELLEQSVYRDVKPDWPAFQLLVANMMGSSKGTVLLVVDDNDRPQGFLLGMIDTLFFSRDRYGTDLALYVREGYRNLAPMLLKRFITWAKSKPRVKHITMGLASGIGDPSRVGRMYEALGLSQVGGIYFQKV